MRHRLDITDDDLRVIVYGLDLYISNWRNYAKRRQRDSEMMRGVRINSGDEKSLIELCRVDVLVAEDKITAALRLRERLTKFIVPTK